MLDSLTNNTVRLLAGAAASAVLAAGLIGCQSHAKQADAFGGGADRPPTPRTLHMMAKLINENGRFDQAEFVLTRIINDAPDYLPAYVELADLYIERGRFGDAIATLQGARTVAPNDAVIANNLGVLMLREKNLPGAATAFRSAVENDPEEARYHANLAVSLAMQGHYEQAYAAWASVLPPEEVFWNIGVVAEARGDQAIATDYFASANRIRKGLPDDEGDAYAAEPNGDEYGPVPTATVSVPVD